MVGLPKSFQTHSKLHLLKNNLRVFWEKFRKMYMTSRYHYWLYAKLYAPGKGPLLIVFQKNLKKILKNWSKISVRFWRTTKAIKILSLKKWTAFGWLMLNTTSKKKNTPLPNLKKRNNRTPMKLRTSPWQIRRAVPWASCLKTSIPSSRPTWRVDWKCWKKKENKWKKNSPICLMTPKTKWQRSAML